MGSTGVSVEATKVANHELEWGRGLQRQAAALGTLCATPFLKEAAGKRDRSAVLNEGFARPSIFLGNTIEAQDKFWLTQAESMVRRKTEIFRRPDFEKQ